MVIEQSFPSQKTVHCSGKFAGIYSNVQALEKDCDKLIPYVRRQKHLITSKHEIK